MENNEVQSQGMALDRETKLMLLKWLKNGYIDKMEFLSLKQMVDDSMTMEEIQDKLDRLASEDDCERLKRLGICPYSRHHTNSVKNDG